MLADGAEASVRAAALQSDEEIEQIVHGVVDRRLSDGELDDCDLTLRDLQRIADSFVATLKAMYHPRVRYPKAVDGEPVRRRSRAGERPGRRGRRNRRDRAERSIGTCSSTWTRRWWMRRSMRWPGRWIGSMSPPTPKWPS